MTLVKMYIRLVVFNRFSTILTHHPITVLTLASSNIIKKIQTMGVDHFDDLPAEIRLHIFRLATIKISQHEDTHRDYRPFEAVALYDRDWSYATQQALNVKRRVMLVSKEWKKIATEMMYECIRVGTGTDSLIKALEGPLAEEPDINGERRTFDNGRWVRRVEISPEMMDFDPFNPLPLLRIMQSCPSVEVIVRPCTSIVGGPGVGKVRTNAFPTFPNVKRIEWWLPSSLPRSPKDATQAGFSGFLGQLTNHCPNLEYLTLSGSAFNMFREPNNKLGQGALVHDYPHVKTLRLEGEDWTVPLPNTSLLFPGLRNLVIGIAYTPAQWILKANGHHVRVLELLNVGFPSYSQHSPEAKAWSTKELFKLCPNIEELCVSLGMGDSLAKQNELGVVFRSLKCIRVKFQPGLVIQATQFVVFVRNMTCHALERIVLHGEEREWRENVCFPMLERHVKQLRYVALEFA